ncbi:hypothetical protein VTN00DRAFT_6442 [Thermoascus crustaceus]|uniref:uncharacterized protein n=1 Tax=Thermoascus crustaceus TaxID=5088 RepID=UPI003743E6E8
MAATLLLSLKDNNVGLVLSLRDIKNISIISTLFALLLWYCYLNIKTASRRRRAKHGSGCQEPARYPHRGFFGIDLIRLRTEEAKRHEFLQREQERIERIGRFGTYALVQGFECSYITADPQIVERIHTSTDFSLSPLRMANMQHAVGPGIFSTDGARWRQSRLLVQPTFHRTRVAQTLERLAPHAEALIARIPGDGLTTVNLQPLFFLLMLDTATDFLFGEPAHSLTHYSELGAALDRCARLRQSVEIIEGFANSVIEKALTANSGIKSHTQTQMQTQKQQGYSYSFLRELMQRTDNRHVLQAELVNVLMAGRDTTASLLSNLWFELHRQTERSDVLRRLRAEVDALEGKIPSLADLRRMEYLDWCVKEALRLFPPVPLNARCAVRDTVLPRGGGPDGTAPVFIPEGTTVTFNVYAMQRSMATYGPDAAVFNPDRWNGLRPGWSFVPFGRGPRNCLGRDVAMDQVKFVTVRLLQTFEMLEPKEHRPWREKLTLTCCSKDGVKVEMRRR